MTFSPPEEGKEWYFSLGSGNFIPSHLRRWICPNYIATQSGCRWNYLHWSLLSYCSSDNAIFLLHFSYPFLLYSLLLLLFVLYKIISLPNLKALKKNDSKDLSKTYRYCLKNKKEQQLLQYLEEQWLWREQSSKKAKKV